MSNLRIAVDIFWKITAYWNYVLQSASLHRVVGIYRYWKIWHIFIMLHCINTTSSYVAHN